MIVALVLLSALLHATWNAMLRVEKAKDQIVVAAVGIATVFAAIVAVVRIELGEIAFATGAGVLWAVVAGTFEAIYFATLIKAMERGRLGVVYTITRGGAVLVVWPLSIALFSEAPTLPAIAGSLVVLGGLALSGLGGKAAGASAAAGANGAGAIGWAIVCAGAIGGYHLAYKAALTSGANPSACFALAMVVSVAINFARLRAPDRGALPELLRRRWPQLVLMGLVCGGSFLILMEALARGGSGFVLTLRNTSVLFAVAMAVAIGERPNRLEVLGATAVAGGAALMAWQ